MFLLLLLVTTAAMAASVKVTAHYKKGDYCVYHIVQITVANSPLGGKDTLTYEGDVCYKVTDERPDGYTLEAKNLKWTDLNPQEGLAGELAIFMMKMSENVPAIIETDIDGKFIHYLNMDEIKAKLIPSVDSLVEKLIGGHEEQLNGIMDKETLKKAFTNEINEENLLNSLGGQVFGLYGKTISTGMMEDETMSLLKMKTTYVVPPFKKAEGYTIKSSSVSNMSKEDIKAYFIAQIEKMMPEQADMVRQNIDMLLESGNVKMDGTKQCTYEFLKSGWIKSAETSMTINIMGAETSSTTKMTIKECSWK